MTILPYLFHDEIMIPMDEQVLADMMQELASYRKMTKHFGLSEDQAKHKNAADWMIDCMKQSQTAAQIASSMRKFQYDNQKVENYNSETKLPEVNPLLGKLQK